MGRSKQFTIEFPRLGLNQAGPYDQQPPLTSPSLSNCWPLDSSTGRVRGGIRPSKITLGAHGASTPYHATNIAYTVSSTTTVGLALCGTNGTFISSDGASFTEHISTNVGSLTWPDQASCTVYQGYLYQASAGSSTVRRRDFVGGSEEALTATEGSVPTKCGLIVRHGNRIWLAGDKDNPHVFYASKIGDPTDWDYTNVTTAGAFVSTGSEGGLIGEPIVAMLSQNDNCLLIGTLTSVYAVFGNARAGQVRRISSQVGPLGNNAWCNDASGNTWMVTSRGLYRIPAGAGGVEPMSEAIPNQLIGIDPADGDRVAVGYDHRWPGIHIFVDYNSGTDKSFFYSLQTGGFFPQTFATMPRLALSFPKIQTDNNSSIVLFDSTNCCQYKRDPEGGDSAESRDSEVWIHIPLAHPGGEGVLQAITAKLAKDSANVRASIYAGDSAEEAFNASAAFTLSQWSYASGRFLNYWQHPRVRGNYCWLKIQDVSNNRWLLEQIIADIAEAGRLRVG